MYFRAIIFALSATMAGMAAIVTATETRAHRALAQTQLDGMSFGISHPLDLPFSTRQLNATLEGCWQASLPGQVGFFTADQTRRTHSHCTDFIARAEPFWPGYGRSSLTRAALAAASGDLVRFQAELARAQRLAPHQGWQAMRRLHLAVDMEMSDQIGPNGGLSFLHKDVALLLTIQPGAEALAAHYETTPGIRPAIALALAAGNGRDRQRFVNLVRLRGLQ